MLKRWSRLVEGAAGGRRAEDFEDTVDGSEARSTFIDQVGNNNVDYDEDIPNYLPC